MARACPAGRARDTLSGVGEEKKVGWSRVLAAAFLFSVVCASLPLIPTTSAQSYSEIAYLQIQQSTSVSVNESQSAQIKIPVNNTGSVLSWTDLRLSFVDPNPGIRITTDPLLFVESIVAESDNFSLSIGISVGENVSLGQYTIPFTLTARSSIYSPSISTSVNFNLVITVLKAAPRPFPLLLLFPPFILIAAGTMIGIVVMWSRNWNISDEKK